MMRTIMLKISIAIYLASGCLASGHWFSNYYDPVGGYRDGSRSAGSAIFVGIAHPVYWSFILFEAQK